MGNALGGCDRVEFGDTISISQLRAAKSVNTYRVAELFNFGDTMARFLSPIGIVCAIVAVCVIASLVTGKTIYIGRTLDASSKRFFDRDLEPAWYWMSVAALFVLFGALLFGTLTFPDR